jgi:hypothetical protein
MAVGRARIEPSRWALLAATPARALGAKSRRPMADARPSPRTAAICISEPEGWIESEEIRPAAPASPAPALKWVLRHRMSARWCSGKQLRDHPGVPCDPRRRCDAHPIRVTLTVPCTLCRKRRLEVHGPCCHCNAVSSPQWRKGPKGKPVLCNACGIRFLRTRSLGKVPVSSASVLGSCQRRGHPRHLAAGVLLSPSAPPCRQLRPVTICASHTLGLMALKAPQSPRAPPPPAHPYPPACRRPPSASAAAPPLRAAASPRCCCPARARSTRTWTPPPTHRSSPPPASSSHPTAPSTRPSSPPLAHSSPS